MRIEKKRGVLVILMLLSFSIGGLKAQTFSEWFAQKKTQKKYLLQQIAALKVYAGYLEKGYGIAGDGLSAINDFKNGEFSLHKAYFGSLKTVNPAVKHYAMVTDIIELQLGILRQYKNAYQRIKSGDWFNRNEAAYIFNVFDKLSIQCAATIDELITLTTNGTLDLKGDERLSRIDALQKDMRDKAAFTQSFCRDINLLVVQRSKAHSEGKVLKQAYGLNQ